MIVQCEKVNYCEQSNERSGSMTSALRNDEFFWCSGCPQCRKQFGTVTQFVDHLAEDVLPALLDRLSSESRAS
jgi:hypothetical protein